jgi:hypothetical protein
MYQTELRGKVPSALLSSEDLLTGSVFSFFACSDRRRFLASWLKMLGLAIGDQEADRARFQFWPTFDDGTEPDLLIEVGAYLILVEAKLQSDFGVNVEDKEANQLPRELRGGRQAARDLGLELRLLTITAEPFPRSPRYKDLNEIDRSIWIPTNWQAVATWLERLPATDQTDMSRDLLEVLRRRGLRCFSGFNHLSSSAQLSKRGPPLFFQGQIGTAVNLFESIRTLPVPAPRSPVFLNLTPVTRNRRRP